jgi:hypothetical protein
MYHNELDIVSLAALYCHVARALEGRTRDGLELMRSGDVWSSLGCGEQAEHMWEMALSFPLSRADAALRMAYLAKKASRFDAAKARFELALYAMLEGGSSSDISLAALYEELAKLEEHKFRAPSRAMEHTRNALDWLRKNRYLLGRAFFAPYKSLSRRAERLERILYKKTGQKNCDGSEEALN